MVPANHEPIITGCRARGERERDVARVAHAAVGPDVRAELARGVRGLEHRRELRPADGGHHARRAHRPRADADLQDVGAGLDEVGDRVGGDDVARDDRDAEPEVAHDRDGPEHALLVAVRGVDHEHVDARPRRAPAPSPRRRR